MNFLPVVATTTTTTIPSAPPSARLSVSPQIGTDPQVAIADGRLSTAATGRRLVSWFIDPGDGSTPRSGTPPNIGTVLAYAQPGTYTVLLVVTDDRGNTGRATAVITIGAGATTPTDEAPTARLSATPTSGAAPLRVTLNGSASDPASRWTIRFGDGQTQSGVGNVPADIPHTYDQSSPTPVSYTAELIVFNDQGTPSIPATKIITVSRSNLAPVASLRGAPTVGRSPLTVVFNPTASDADGDIVSWELNPGVGAVIRGVGAPPATINVPYSATAGTVVTRNATISVTDNLGLRGTSGPVAVRISNAAPINQPIIPGTCYLGSVGDIANAALFTYRFDVVGGSATVGASPSNNVRSDLGAETTPPFTQFVATSRTVVVRGNSLTVQGAEVQSSVGVSLAETSWTWELSPNIARAQKDTVVTDENRCIGAGSETLITEGQATPAAAERGAVVNLEVLARHPLPGTEPLFLRAASPVVLVLRATAGVITRPGIANANGWNCAASGPALACMRADDPVPGYVSRALRVPVVIPEVDGRSFQV